MTKVRTYTRTHPWIKFALDLRRVSYELWLALGEAQSKCEHIAGVPLTPSVAKELHIILLAKGAWATTSIEGNTLSEAEVRLRLEGKLDLPPSKEYLGQEVDNIGDAANLILQRLVTGHDTNLSVGLIQAYNRMVLKDLELDDGVVPASLEDTRSELCGISVRLLGANIDEKLCEWLNGSDFCRTDGNAIIYGLLRAILAHLYVASIHPFGDGNGRTARLIEYQNPGRWSPSPAAHLLSNHYNTTRQEYYQQLDYASTSGGDVVPFLMYAIRGFIDGLKEHLEVIKRQQLDLTWRDYIHATFRDQKSAPDLRRRRLVLDLSDTEAPVPLAKIKSISPKVANRTPARPARRS